MDGGEDGVWCRVDHEAPCPLTYVSFLVRPLRHGCCGATGPEPRVGGAIDSRLPPTTVASVVPPDAVTRPRHHPIVTRE